MALPLHAKYSLPLYSLASPRSQIEMLESSFEDIYPPGKLFEPRQKSLDLSTTSLNSSAARDLSSIAEMNPYLMTPDEWRVIQDDANSISACFKDVADREANDDWDALDFDLRSSHCPWEISMLNLPELDSLSNNIDQDNLIEFSDSKNPFNIGMLSLESHLNSTTLNSNLLLDMDDSLTVTQLLKTPPVRNTSYTISKAHNSPVDYDFQALTAAELLKTPENLMESYTIAKGNSTFDYPKADSPAIGTKGNSSYTISKGNSSFVIEERNVSYTVAKGNASYTISSPPMEISPIPVAASKNSSFSEVAEKFHSLRRSMSSDSVMPLSQGKISGLSLTTRALVPTPPLQPVDAGFSAAVADMRLRPGRAPLTAKGPMRAMLPLGQMMRAPVEVPLVEPAAKKHSKQVSSPIPSAKCSPVLNPSTISTPVKKGLTRRSISMSPIRRSTPTRSLSSGYGQRSPSSGYGQRRPVDATVAQKRQTFVVPGSPAQRGPPTNVASNPKSDIPKMAIPTAPASRLKWPSTKGAGKPSSLPQPNMTEKVIPKPVLAVTNPNVRVSRLKPPSRMPHALPLTVKGKENRH